MIDYVRALGKGPGFVGFAFFCVGVLAAIHLLGRDITLWTGPLGVVCGGLYAGGFLKAFADAKGAK